MKILATFDGSALSQSTVPELEWMAQLPGVAFTLLSVARAPNETARERSPAVPTAAGMAAAGGTAFVIPAAEVRFIEDRSEAIARVIAERLDYLREISGRLPAGPSYATEVLVGSDAAASIIQYAMSLRPDVIVMGMHGETGMIHRLFGDVAEQVVHSGVAPVLLVHPATARHVKATTP